MKVGINIDHRLICFHALQCLLSLFLQSHHQGGRVCSLPAGNKSKIFFRGSNKILHLLLVLLLKGLYLCLGLNCPSNLRRSHHQNFPDITGAWSSAVSVLVPFCLSVVHRDRNLTFFNLHCSHTSDLRVLGLSCPLAVSLSCSFPSCLRPTASHH